MGDFYTKSSVPATKSQLSSATIRAEFALIEAGFDKLPALTGNGSKFLRVNSGATAVEALSASDVRTALSLVVGTNVQAYDAELAAIAGLTSAADKVPYFTGSGTAAVADFTAGGRALVNSAGTADTFPYFSASNTVTLGSITSAGRALLDDADATAQLATLGVLIATQTHQEAGSDLTALVTSGTQHYHQSAAKGWVKVEYSGSTPSAVVSYNVSSITDTGTGLCTINIGTDFSSSNYGSVATINEGSADFCRISSIAAGSFLVSIIDIDTGGPSLVLTDADFTAIFFGDQ